MELLRWSPRDRWTLEQACLGSLITGAIGSGKTSGPFQYISRSFIRAGFGGLFLCAKVDAAKEYQDLAASEGRSGDVIVFRPGEHGFNFLTYEAQRPGAGKAIIENILMILMQAAEVASRKHGSNRGDDFFEEAMKQLLRNCLHVVIAATGGVDLGVVLEIVQTLPQRLNDLEEPEKFRSLQILAEAEAKASSDRAEEMRLARTYFTNAWPGLSDRTRSSIAITLEVLLDSFMRYPLRDLLLRKTSVTPDDVLAGKLVVIDVAVKEFDLIGKIAGVIWKYSMQRAIERRPGLADHAGDNLRPIFIAADEAQFWATSWDTLFQMTARSARGCTVYGTQNLPNFYAEIGGEGAGVNLTNLNIPTLDVDKAGVSRPATGPWDAGAFQWLASGSPPTLTLSSPANGTYTVTGSITVSGTASSASGIQSVTANGAAATTSNAYANWTGNVSGLSVGNNTVLVVATDNSASHLTTTESVSVIYASGTYDGNGDGLPDAWQIQYFGTGFATNPNAGPNANPAGDGTDNLLKYAFGMDPTVASTALLPTTAIQNIGGTNYLTITFHERPAASSEVTYTVQISPDLVDWSSTGVVQVGSAVPDSNGITQTVTFQDSVPSASAPRRFIRVQIN
jgi:hypothetical protein